MNNIWIALGLTLFAGMATGIGSIIAFTAKRSNYRFLSLSTGFSAGVMLYVSFVEIFMEGGKSLALIYGEKSGHWINAASFFGGILLIAIVDYFIPEGISPNDDGKNDAFYIIGLEKHPNNELTIFNRWGNKVYEAKPYKNNWKGTNEFGLSLGGIDLPEDTYFYILQLSPDKEPIIDYLYITR